MASLSLRGIYKIYAGDVVAVSDFNLEIEDKESGERTEILCDGLFVAIGLIPDNNAFALLADLDVKGYFDSDEHCRTKTPGIYTAGDCRKKPVRQLTTAVADGACAALAACRYISFDF